MIMQKKNSIKRAQSQARLSFAERKNFRPMAKILTLLVLLMTAVTGARAAWTGGTYTATANENLNAITVSDDATLTINADVTVTVTGGIVVADGKTLTITGGGTLVANGANGANGGTGQTGNAGGTAIAGNVIINGVGLTVTATGGQGGKGGQGGQGDEGNEGSPGGQGGQGGTGAQGANGGSAFSGAVTIYAGSVTATGGQGGQGGKGGTGGTGGYGSNEYDNGGQGGKGGTGGTGGQGGHAFAGTLTVYGGNVSAYGGQRGMYGNGGDGGDGGDSDLGHSGDPGDTGDDGENGASGYAYANSVTFETATYTVKDNSGYPINLNNITSEQNVIIQSADAELIVTYSVALADGSEDAANWQGKAGEGEYQALPLEGVAAGTAVSVKYNGTKKVIGVKAEKKSSVPTLKDALADGATVVINYVWFDENETTFTYTNNGGTYTGNTTGVDAGNFNNGMSKDGTTLNFTASNPGYTGIDVSIVFYTDTNEYVISKQNHFTSFTISVNGTDVTSQLTKVK